MNLGALAAIVHVPGSSSRTAVPGAFTSIATGADRGLTVFGVAESLMRTLDEAPTTESGTVTVTASIGTAAVRVRPAISLDTCTRPRLCIGSRRARKWD